MNPFETYVKYLAIKQHFTQPGYDYFKYNGKVRANPQSFDTRKDKYFFHKLSKIDDVDNYIMANLLDDPNKWAGDLVSDKGDQIYTAWKKRMESLSYVFKNEINSLDEDLNKNFVVEDGQHPYILRQYLRKNISLDTFVILEDILKFCKHFDKTITDTIIWPGVKLKMTKYKPFLTYDKFKMRKILKEKFYAEA